MLTRTTNFSQPFMTRSLQLATVLGEFNGDYYGRIDEIRGALAARWNANGHHLPRNGDAVRESPRNLVCFYPSNAAAWSALTSDQREIARCIVDQHPQRKLRAVRLLRICLAWGREDAAALVEEISSHA